MKRTAWVLLQAIVPRSGARSQPSTARVVGTVTGDARARQFAARPVAWTTEALQSAMPGLTVIQRAGQRVRQRIGLDVPSRDSLNDTTSLVLIHGIEGDFPRPAPRGPAALDVALWLSPTNRRITNA